MSLRDRDVVLALGPAFMPRGNGVLTRRTMPFSRGGEELKETFSRGQIGAYIDRDGNVRSAAVDAIRPHWMFSNDDAANRKVVALLEEQATNIILQSSVFGTTWAPTRASISSNADTAPDGSATADRLVEDATATNNHFLQQTTLTITANASVTLSVYAKAGTRSWLYLKLQDSTNARSVATYFDLGNGALGATTDVAGGATLVARYIEPLANGWYRCIIVVTLGGGFTNVTALAFLATGNNSIVYSGDGASYLSLWRAQLEDNAQQPSSGIETTVAPVLRNRDVLSFPLYVTPGVNLCIYHRHIERLSPNWVTAGGANTRVWQFGKADGSNPNLLLSRPAGGSNYRGQHNTAGGNSTSEVSTLSPAYLDLIETRLVYTAVTGVVQTGAAKNLGAEILAAAGSALTPGAAWSDVILNIHSRGDTAGHDQQGWIATVVAMWTGAAPSMAELRAYSS